MNAVADKLREARALIERGWCQGWFAQDASGDDCMERDAKAVCWCSGGAIWRVAGVANGTAGRMLQLFMEANDLRFGIAAWNDAEDRTKAEVLAAFDKAIEIAEAAQ